ncbi:hypothetical protein [Aminivibrio sp.]|uniref:hypothetical protein n=1 Tax=Aminivibrio sp. TaxID=1872489 RepID=UPI00345EC2BC
MRLLILSVAILLLLIVRFYLNKRTGHAYRNSMFSFFANSTLCIALAERGPCHGHKI